MGSNQGGTETQGLYWGKGLPLIIITIIILYCPILYVSLQFFFDGT